MRLGLRLDLGDFRLGCADRLGLVNLVRVPSLQLGLGLAGAFPVLGGVGGPALVVGLCCFQFGALAVKDDRERCGFGFGWRVHVGVSGAHPCLGLGEGDRAELVGRFGRGGLGLLAAADLGLQLAGGRGPDQRFVIGDFQGPNGVLPKRLQLGEPL